MERKYYPFLDGFRALAIIWVMLHHINEFFRLDLVLDRVTERIFVSGSMGVDVFFVTSGFLITGLLIDEVDKGTVNIKRFYLRRFFKIVPSYVLVLLVGIFTTLLAHGDFQPKQVLSYLFMYQNYAPPLPLLRHLWSIAVEEHFYLVYPLILSLACLFISQAAKRRTFMMAFLVLMIISGNLIRYWWFSGHWEVHGPNAYVATHVRFDALMLGCLIKFLEPFFYRPEKGQGRALPSLCFILGFMIYVYVVFTYGRMAWDYYTLVYMGTGFMLVSALTGFQPVKRLTENPWLRSIGRNSYGIYLWHYPLIFYFSAVWQKTGHIYLCIAAYAALSILLGYLSTRTVEKSFLLLRNRIIP